MRLDEKARECRALQRLAPAQECLEMGGAFGVRGIPALSDDRRF
jgi:hypothetical protein